MIASTTHTLADFLDVLFEPDDLVELRPLRHDAAKNPPQQWMKPAELAGMNGRLEQINTEASIYFGVAPRNARGGREEHVSLCRCLFCDFDDGATWSMVGPRIDDAGLPFPSSVVRTGGGIHVYWRLEDAIEPSEFKLHTDNLVKLLGADEGAKGVPRVMRLPGTVNRKPTRNGAACEILLLNDDRHDIEDFVRCFPEPEATPANDIASQQGKKSDGSSADRLEAMRLLESVPAKCADSYAAWIKVGQILHQVDDGPIMLAAWDAWSRNSEKYVAGECASKWQTFNAGRGKIAGLGSLRHMARGEIASSDGDWPVAAAPVESSSTEPIRLARENTPIFTTDLGNGIRFAHHNRGKALWCEPWQKWLAWDGRRWSPDSLGRVRRLAEKTVRSIFDEAKNATDTDVQDRLSKWAISSQSVTRFDAMLKQARHQDGITVDPDLLDADAWLLNTTSGIVDLRTGEVSKHDPAKLCTHLAPVAYEPAMPTPGYDKFMQDIMLGHADLIEYIERMLGYILTGDVRHQVLPIFYGEGKNGKSTLLDLAMHIMGDYACQAPESLLTVKQHAEHPTELARLAGKRLAIASETEEGQRLRIQQVKRLTGDATIAARFMRGDYFDFKRTFKLIMATNNRPTVRENTVAVWRRLRMVPFDYTVPDAEMDPQLPNKLEAEAPGILARWVAAGLRWQREGHDLAEPESVKAATESYQQDEDVLGPFVDATCLINPASRVSRGELFDAYGRWADATREPKLPRKAFFERVRKLVFVEESQFKVAGKKQRGFAGIGLVSAVEHRGYA